LVLAAVEGQPLPPVSRETTPVLFGPGLHGLSRPATSEEVTLWERLGTPEALSVLSREGHRREAIERLVAAGIVEAFKGRHRPRAERSRGSSGVG